MCVMSAVMTDLSKIPLTNWNLPAYTDLQTVLEAVRKLDEKLGQVDCVDPEKAKILKRIEERLANVEQNTSPLGPSVVFIVKGYNPGMGAWNVKAFSAEFLATRFLDTITAWNTKYWKTDIIAPVSYDTHVLRGKETIYTVEKVNFE